MKDTPSRGARRRWRVATLVTCLGIPSVVIGAEPSTETGIQARFAEGQERFKEQRYVEAAEIFTEVLRNLDEALLNRVRRENVMRNVLIAYEWAYRSSTDDDGRKDITQLDAGQRVLDEYREELSRAYESKATPSPELAEIISRYEEARRVAHEAHGPAEAETEPEPMGPCLTPSPPPPTARGKGCGADESQSVAWLGVLALPVVRRRRRRALDQLADRLPPDVVQRLRARIDEP